MRSDLWLVVAGLGTWIVSSVITGTEVARGTLTGPSAAAWVIAFLAFGAGFAFTCRRPASRASAVGALLVQTAAALLMVGISRESLSGALLVVVAGQLPWVSSPRLSALWIGAQTLGLALIIGRFASPLSAASVAAAFGGFQVFALATGLLARRERTAREALALANRELHASRGLVADMSRASERLRISRDLHDALGHHLTALSLQLDVAGRLAEGTAADHVRQAHAIARLLLADVRDVVGQLRESAPVDVVAAIRDLLREPSAPTVHFAAPPALDPLDPDRAQALIRCVQEVLTNAARHADARHVWITLSEDAEGVCVHARDDGRGAGPLTWGHGLRGMRERFEALSGHMDVRTEPGGGFEVRSVVPRSVAS